MVVLKHRHGNTNKRLPKSLVGELPSAANMSDVLVMILCILLSSSLFLLSVYIVSTTLCIRCLGKFVFLQ